MGKSVELFNGIGSKDGNPIEATEVLEYTSPSRSYTDIDGESDDVLPNKKWVKGYVLNNTTTPISIPVTNPSSAFSYNSGVTGSIPPKASVYIVRSGIWQEYAKPFWNPTTGVLTTDVDASADTYYLVVG